ncbi:hypothetical protein GCM10029992_06040 [Glycomyces albus]
MAGGDQRRAGRKALRAVGAADLDRPRPDSTIVIRDDFASNRHARVAPREGQWMVEDLGSTNGTYLGRARVTQPTPVPLGVPIRIGRSSFELRA